MTRVRIESLGLDVDPDRRIVYMEDGSEQSLTRREFQALKAQVRGATSLAEIAEIMSEAERSERGALSDKAANPVDEKGAVKHLSTLRDKLGVLRIPLLKRGRKS